MPSSSSTTSRASPSRRSSSSGGSGNPKDPIMVDDEDDNDKIVNSLSKMEKGSSPAAKSKQGAAGNAATYSSDTNSGNDGNDNDDNDDIQLNSKGKSKLKLSKVNNNRTARRGTPISSAATIAAARSKRKGAQAMIDDDDDEDDDDKVIFPLKDPKSPGTSYVIPHRRRKPGNTFGNHSTQFITDDTDSWVSTTNTNTAVTSKRDAAIIQAAAVGTSPINTKKRVTNNRNNGSKNSPAVVVDAKIIQTTTRATSPIAIATLLHDNNDDDNNTTTIDDDDDDHSGPKTRNGSSTKKRAKPPAPKPPVMPPGMDTLDQYITLAKIEVESDPYRGIRSIWQQKKDKNDIINAYEMYQWKYCYFGSNPLPGWEHADDMPSEIDWETDESYLAQYMSRCTCPSMVTWLHPVKNSNSNTKRKRKSLQSSDAAVVPFQYKGRPENPQYRCVCDSNPFCLASLGGIVDTIIADRFREVTRTGDQDPKNLPSPKRTKSSMDSMAFVVETEDEKKVSSSPHVYDVDDENDDAAPVRFERPRRCPEWLNPFPEPVAPSNEMDETVSPASVFFEKDHNQKYAPSQVYSDTTQQELNQARRSLTLRSSKIRHFVYNTLGIQHTSSDGPSVCEYMKKLAHWQKSLLFPDKIASSMIALPNSIHDSDGESCTTLAVPPGIQNLGATCYLNSQLQCLAQNPAFLEGIFTWRPPQQDAKGGETAVASFQQHHHDPMTRVLIELQNFLAALVHGGTKTQSTLQFSNALGLEHGEQQDPNEFARLLFERMEDSFRECSRKTSKDKDKSMNDDEGVSDLGNLLKNIFEGVTTYETTCLKCKSKSERSEGFMDLNVPIVSRPATTSSKGSKGTEDSEQLKTLKDFWDKSTSKEKSEIDTDVQYCLDEAYQVEVFDGDNQYFCSACNSKQDAERRAKLTKLPPVLNLQLSRYIFDRETFAKKKVSDKVLLPTILSVPYCGDKSNCREFLLCAVMRHQGSSAYRGHYVAEAMDWCTGVWYEFNDERVDYLPNGPSCSHNPSEDFDGRKLVGSQDAYNMYYVDRSFLAKQARRCLLRRDKLVEQHLKATMQSEHNFALYAVASMRKERYKVLSEFCIQDRKTSARLKRREAGVRSFMFPDCGAFSAPSDADEKDQVWVNAEFLRRYLSQDRSMDMDIAGSRYIINNRPYLCRHQRLCPRAARRGKLLSSKQFNALVSLLQGERALLQGKCEGDLERVGPIIDCKLSSRSEIECQECMLSYTTELSRKVELAQLLRSIYPFLNQSTPACSIEYSDEDRPSSVEEGFAYIVAKSTLSKLKKEITAFVKNLVDIYEGTILDGNSSMVLPETKCEGLDALDLSRFEFGKESLGYSDKAYSTSSQSSDDPIDERINGSITCVHGNVSTHNKTRIRHLSWQQWCELKSLFPNAIEHTQIRRSESVTEFIDDGGGCDKCGAEKASFDNLATRLEQWASMVKKNRVLTDLYEGDIDANSESLVSDYIKDSGRCRLVHKSDVITWRTTVAKLLKIKKLNASDSAELRSIVEELAFPNYHSVVLECCEGEPKDKLLASMHSLICGAHKQCVHVAVFNSDTDEGKSLDDTSLKKQLSHGITVLNNDEYLEFVSSLIDLLKILHPSGTATVYASPLDEGFNEHRKRVMQQIKSYHPEITKEGSKDTAHQVDGFWFSLDGKQEMYSLFPDVCKVPSCQKEFAPSLLSKKVPDVNVNGRTTGLGSVPANPIIVETEADEAIGTPETGVQLRVFHVEEGKAMDAAISPLIGILGGSNTPESELDGDANLRRSTRKRKSRFPCDVLLGEDVVKVGLHHNIAALRLLLLQSCAVPIAGCTVALVVTNLTKESPRMIFLEPGWNERSLNVIIEDEKFEDIDRSLILGEPASHISLLCQKVAITASQSAADETSIMDSLLSTSNLSSDSDKKRASNGKKRRSAERGFRGTLLSSTANRNGQDAAASELAISSANTGKDASTVSDEDKASQDQANTKIVSAQLVQNVLSDDDDDETKNNRGGGDDDSIPPLPLETTGKMRDEKLHAVPAAASNTAIVENESGSDMDCEAVESPRPMFPTAGQRQIKQQAFEPKGWDDADVAPTATEQLVDDVTTQLLEIVAQPPDREVCNLAAVWAQKNNSRTSNAIDLIDAAFMKYTEIMQKGPKETAA